MEAAQTNVYYAPASRADMARSIRVHTIRPLAKKRGESIPPSKARLRVHSTHKDEETMGKPASREETAPLPIHGPCPRPLMAVSQRFRSCMGTSVSAKNPGAYRHVPRTSRNS